MGGMVKGKGDEWEERTDGIMQILRAICLKCMCPVINHHLVSSVPLVTDGAGLFYTTTQPTTLNVLRQYALHALFVPPAPASDGLLDGATAPTRNPFPFVHTPNTLDRDRIVIPAGWDSWGKIAVLRDGFDVRAWGEAWEEDLSVDAEADEESEAGARKLYAALVPDQGPKVRTPPYCIIRKLMLIGGLADPAPTAQQPDARTSFSRKELRRERAARRPRPARHFPQPCRRVRAARRRTCRTAGLVILLSAGGRAGARRDGERRLGGNYHAECGDGPRQARGRTDIADHGERAESDGADAARGAAEFLQELVEHQGPRAESWHLGCESRRGTWKGGTDGSENVGGRWWCERECTDGWRQWGGGWLV